jgi:hypothetical protein
MEWGNEGSGRKLGESDYAPSFLTGFFGNKTFGKCHSFANEESF